MGIKVRGVRRPNIRTGEVVEIFRGPFLTFAGEKCGKGPNGAATRPTVGLVDGSTKSSAADPRPSEDTHPKTVAVRGNLVCVVLPPSIWLEGRSSAKLCGILKFYTRQGIYVDKKRCVLDTGVGSFIFTDV